MPDNKKQILAIDFGGSSGRAMLGSFDGNEIKFEEIHRFENNPVIIGKTLYWDILRLFFEVKQSLLKAKKYGKIDSISIDTWGVDFGMLDESGRLLDNPVHYRDGRTKGIMKKAFEKILPESLYQLTGNQIMEINTAFQLLSVKEKQPELFSRINKIVMMPDLFNYLLTGNIKAESSIASTTQLFDAKQKCWCHEAIEKLGFPDKIFPDIVKTGTVIGELSDDVCEELSVSKSKVIAVAGHDTQSAMVAVPTNDKDFIFISCGTWSLVGTELDEPIINESSAELAITNENGFGNKTSFLKNIIGLWLIQESRRQWIREGKTYGFGELEKMAQETIPFKCFIDPDDEMFVTPGNIPERIRNYCRNTNQEIPETIGEIVRCIDESLAIKYCFAIDEIKQCTGKNYESIYIVGGGSQSELLCQMTASACNTKVFAGPTEATVLGNMAVALMTAGDIENISEARKIIKNSQKIKQFQNKDFDLWAYAIKKYKVIVKTKQL